MTGEPTLSDDEATLAAYAEALVDAFEHVAHPWFERLVSERLPQALGDQAIADQLRNAAAHAVADLRELLQLDIADQPTGPLEVLRRAASGTPTDILQAAGVPTPHRDEFSRANFPNDLYAMSPASFRDVDPSLHEPGLMWGAAKAHVHLRRRREATAE